MHSAVEALLDIYRSDPHTSFSTSELVMKTFPEEYEAIMHDIEHPDIELQKKARRNKASLHRKLLHHINKLVTQEVLRIESVEAHGEKKYVLALSAGEMIFQGKQDTVTILKPQQPKTFTQEYEDTGIVISRDNSMHKIESYAINAKAYDDAWQLVQDIKSVCPHISDCLGLIGVESLLHHDPHQTTEAIMNLLSLTTEYGIAVTIHLNITDLPFMMRHFNFFENYAQHNPKRSYIVLRGRQEDLITQHASLTQIAKLWGQYSIKLIIQNESASKAPLLLGHAGTYRLPENSFENSKGVVVSASSLTIDLAKRNMKANELKQLSFKAAKTLLSRVEAKQKESRTALRGLQALGPIWAQLENMNVYLRIWGADWKRQEPGLLAEINEELQRFSMLESRIFWVAGTPLRFKLHLSSAFPHYHPELSERQYKKMPVYGRNNLDQQELPLRERLCKIYASDRVRVFRDGTWHGADLLGEITYIINHYDIPLVLYDFASLQQRMTLKDFLVT